MADNAMTGLVFKEEHQYQGADEEGREDLQGDGIAVRRFFDQGQQQRTGDTGSAPGRKNTSVNSTEFACAEEVRKVGRHAREAAAIAGDDEQYENLEAKGVSQLGKLPEGDDFNGEEEDICSRTAKLVRSDSV